MLFSPCLFCSVKCRKSIAVNQTLDFSSLCSSFPSSAASTTEPRGETVPREEKQVISVHLVALLMALMIGFERHHLPRAAPTPLPLFKASFLSMNSVLGVSLTNFSLVAATSVTLCLPLPCLQSQTLSSQACELPSFPCGASKRQRTIRLEKGSGGELDAELRDGPLSPSCKWGGRAGESLSSAFMFSTVRLSESRFLHVSLQLFLRIAWRGLKLVMW
jgi:hypothetical protein